LISVLVCAVFWATYSPSAATGMRPDRLLDYILGMSGGSLFLTLGWRYDRVRDALMMLVLIGTGLMLCWKLMTNRLDDEPLIPIGALFFTISCVSLAVIVGRSAYRGWDPVLKSHFGIVSAPLVPVAVLVLSQKKYTMPVSVLVLLLSLLSYEYSL